MLAKQFLVCYPQQALNQPGRRLGNHLGFKSPDGKFWNWNSCHVVHWHPEEKNLAWNEVLLSNKINPWDKLAWILLNCNLYTAQTILDSDRNTRVIRPPKHLLRHNHSNYELILHGVKTTTCHSLPPKWFSWFFSFCHTPSLDIPTGLAQTSCLGDVLIPQHISNALLQVFLSGAAASQPEQKLAHLS